MESILAGHPAVAESAAVGVPDPIKGQSIVCVVQLRDGVSGGQDLKEELRTRVARELGKGFKPTAVYFLPDLPRTRSSKILRRMLGAVLRGDDPGDLSNLANPAALEALRAQIAPSAPGP